MHWSSSCCRLLHARGLLLLGSSCCCILLSDLGLLCSKSLLLLVKLLLLVLCVPLFKHGLALGGVQQGCCADQEGHQEELHPGHHTEAIARIGGRVEEGAHPVCAVGPNAQHYSSCTPETQPHCTQHEVCQLDGRVPEGVAPQRLQGTVHTMWQQNTQTP